MRNKGVRSEFRKLYWTFLSEVLKGYSWLLGVSPNGTKFIYYSPHDYQFCDFDEACRYAEEVNRFMASHFDIDFSRIIKSVERKFTEEEHLEAGLAHDWQFEFGIEVPERFE